MHLFICLFFEHIKQKLDITGTIMISDFVFLDFNFMSGIYKI